MLINNDWEIVLDPKGLSGTIRLRADLHWWTRTYLVWFKRFPVLNLYRDFQAWLSDLNHMHIPEIMRHGSMRATDEVKKKVPTVFQLEEGWRIESESAKALILGPLLNAEGSEIIVPAHGKVISFFILLEQWRIVRFAQQLVALILAIWGLYEIFLYWIK